MNDLIKPDDDEQPENVPANPLLQLKPEFETMLLQIQSIKEIQTSGINLFLFTGINSPEDYAQATRLLASVRAECERIHQIQAGAQVPDLVMLMALVDKAIDVYLEDEDDDWEDDDDDEDDEDEEDDESFDAHINTRGLK